MSSTPTRPTDLPINLGTGINLGNLVPTTPLSPANPTTTSPSPQVNVTVPNASGSVTFQLVVTDNLGVASAPTTFTITIQGAPTAVLTGTPNPVGAGKIITLSGAGSKAGDGGTIASYAYTLVTPATTNPITVTRG